MTIGNTAPLPLHFPESESMPESKTHVDQRLLLYAILKLAFADRAQIGCDQFMYWDPTNPKECLAPDAFVCLGKPDQRFRSWKAWERGVPDVAIEIISHSDSRPVDWEGKLAKYGRLGVRELVRFEGEDGVVSLRIWDSIEGELVERGGVERVAVSRVLPGAWVVLEDADEFVTLRLSRDPNGTDFYPTPEEQQEQERRVAEQSAAARIRELEAELARRR